MRESVYICGQKPVRAAVALGVGIIGLLVCFSVSRIPVSNLIAAIIARHNLGKYSFSSGSFRLLSAVLESVSGPCIQP